MQPNGNRKAYAARDLLLRLEKQGLVALLPRIRPKKTICYQHHAMEWSVFALRLR